MLWNIKTLCLSGEEFLQEMKKRTVSFLRSFVLEGANNAEPDLLV